MTRGDVDLAPILATLPYKDVVIWNDRKRGSRGCFGRYLALPETQNSVVYLQDDDVIFTAHEELLALWEPEKIVANMPDPWWSQTGYDVLDCQLVGAGSLIPKTLPWKAFRLYLEHWPEDELFETYCDQISGIISPGVRHDLGYQVLEYASGPDRIYTQPGASERKAIVQRRAVALRG